LLGSWLLLVAVALWSRPLLPVDETRYLSVAWEMWLRGDFLVPWLNGAPYSHKPPLLFWLIQAGWALFGVNDLWPRLVNPLLALGCLGLLWRLGRLLWPERGRVAERAAWLLWGAWVWLGFATLVQFDLLLVAATLLGMIGLVRAPAAPLRGWGLFGLAIGLGVLAKGPVILLHLLPAALLGPWWRPAPVSAGRWYGGLLAGVLLGAAIGLAWALPAGLAGGPAYREAIFWGQTAHRVVHSFAHRQPFWWYLPVLPLLLLPWSAWPPLWSALRLGRRTARGDRGLRFLLAWGVPVFLLLSLVSGKQAKYLLPLVPALALAGARLLDGVAAARGARPWPVAILFLASAGLVAAVAWFGYRPAIWAGAVEGIWAPVALGAGALLLLVRPPQREAAVRVLALGGVLWMVWLHLALVPALAPDYDMRPLARRIARLQAAGIPVAHVGKYHGQFQYLGRLRRPLPVLRPAGVRAWARQHGDGFLVLYRDDFPRLSGGAVYVQDYRGDSADLMLWPAQRLLRRLDQPSASGTP